MKLYIVGLTLMASLSVFASASITGVGESVPHLKVKGNSQQECQAKLNEVSKKLATKIILKKDSCSLLHEADERYDAVYSGSIMFY